MNKRRFTKFGLLVMLTAVLMFTSSVSATGTVPVASRVVYFSIQSNNLYGLNNAVQYATGITLNINNLSDSENDVIVTLYKKDGTEFNEVGSNENGISSYFVPGSKVTISPISTV
ncbi:hypothetical protein ACFSTH_16965 [Paenibacillus yanchengensis]|uniref:Uncharacterized protein n=1 Tax=Paenibacillus yanchengensis TaxID=2035833 RepID=A0ABW4YQ08_9BACL